ncbi:MAG: DUF808 domain-containing protein [Luminiphilus sp.]|nr:DUF808 domain-containing protein [Luminiphilus sp.]
MAFGSLLALVDDIAAVLDDVALMTKIAAKKTAGVLGDDLAVNAERVLGVRPDRELPVVWAVAKGSFVNKLILVPAALLISAFIPALITPLLVCGGLYLCFEGAEKLVHGVGAHSEEQAAKVMQQLANPDCDLAQLERDKIRGAVRTDFILSAEIIVLTLGVVEGQQYLTQLIVLAGISTLMTVGVYGLVAGIVKIDDLGLLLSQKPGSGVWHGGLRRIGAALLWFAPRLMKGLSVVGTVAMFLVGGGILLHAMPSVAQAIAQFSTQLGPLEGAVPTLCGGALGLCAGFLLVKVFDGMTALRG